MKARSYQIPALLSQIQKDFDVVLFYGTDEGEIQHAFSVLKKEFKFYITCEKVTHNNSFCFECLHLAMRRTLARLKWH